MTVTYGFYNSLNNDRKYDASQISSLFDGVINDGIFMTVAEALVVDAMGGMNVGIGKGRAWFNRTWTDNDAQLLLTVSPSELVLNRIDAVILEINSNVDVRANLIKIIKGIPASIPAPPDLMKTTLLNQYPLCYIYVGAGVAEVIQADITNKVGSSECPFVTGILETINTDLLLAQWDSEFHNWFINLENLLDANTAGNLLNLINQNTTSITQNKVILDDHKAENATETTVGHVQLATDAETTTGTNDTKAVHSAGLKVELDKRLNLIGGTMAGILKAQNNTSYTVAQVRNIILSTGDPVLANMQNGDIWLKYM